MLLWKPATDEQWQCLLKVQSTPKPELNVAYITLIHIHIPTWTPKFLFSITLSLICWHSPQYILFLIAYVTLERSRMSSHHFNPTKPLQEEIHWCCKTKYGSSWHLLNKTKNLLRLCYTLTLPDLLLRSYEPEIITNKLRCIPLCLNPQCIYMYLHCALEYDLVFRRPTCL